MLMVTDKLGLMVETILMEHNLVEQQETVDRKEFGLVMLAQVAEQVG
jgi:hypothetical protein